MNLETEEYKIFCTHHPWKTILKQSIGYLIIQVASSFQTVIQNYYISKKYDERSLAILGMSSKITMIYFAFALLPGMTLSIKISGLLGEKKNEKASQLIFDMFKFGIGISIILPIITLPFIKELLKFMGVPLEFIEESSKIVFPSSLIMIFIIYADLFTNSLLGEGKSILFSYIQIIGIILSSFIIDPFFAFIIKAPLWVFSISIHSGQILCGIFLSIIYFNEKFTLKPKLKMFFLKVTDEFYNNLKLLISSFLYFSLIIVTSTITNKILLNSANKMGIDVEVATVLSVIGPVQLLLTNLMMGTFQGLGPSNSFVNSLKMRKRQFDFLKYSFIVPILIGILCTFIFFVFSKNIMNIWLKSENLLIISQKMIPIFFLTFSIQPIQRICVLFFLSTNDFSLSSILVSLTSFSTIISLLFFNFFYFNNIFKLVYYSLMEHSINVILALSLLYFKISSMLKLNDEKHIDLLTSDVYTPIE